VVKDMEDKGTIKNRTFAWRLSLKMFCITENMERTSSCQICKSANDSWRHSLTDCLMARSVWSLIDEELVEHLSADNIGDPKQWLFSNSNTEP
jgi:hypothetical protein